MNNDLDQLQNGDNFYDYHKNKMNKLISMKNQKGSNLDHFIKLHDSITFTTKQELDEQDKAHDINYAHGLELDDIADAYDINRNNLDDDTFRFLIKSHQLSNRSKGTFKELLIVASNLLGCQPEDIRMINSRVLDTQNNDNHGDKNTVVIKDIDINKVSNANLISILTHELQNAAAGGFIIKQIGFSVSINPTEYIGTEITINKAFQI